MSAYGKSTRAALAAIPGARLEDLAGGCFGIAVPVDGATLILARCPDLGYSVSYATWAGWLVDADGEYLAPVPGDQCCTDLGYVRPRDYAELVPMALAAIRAEMTR